MEATIEAGGTKGGVELQIGYTRRLPKDYVGERHVVTASRLPDGKYQWEERPGPGPGDGGGDSNIIIRLTLVGPKPYKLALGANSKRRERRRNSRTNWALTGGLAARRQ